MSASLRLSLSSVVHGLLYWISISGLEEFSESRQQDHGSDADVIPEQGAIFHKGWTVLGGGLLSAKAFAVVPDSFC